MPVDYVVIRPSEKVCARRAADRAEGIINDYSNYHDLYESFSEAKQFIVHEDDASVVSIAKQIRSGLTAGKFRL